MRDTPALGMMGNDAMGPGSRDTHGSAVVRTKHPKLSAFAKLLRQHIGNWANVPSETPTPDRAARTKFLKEFDKIGGQQLPTIATTSDNFENWWKGIVRPRQASMSIAVVILLGADDAKKEQKTALWHAWTEADVKAARRVKPIPSPKLSKDQTIQPAGLYRPVSRRSEYAETPIVHMAIDFGHPGQNAPLDIDQDMVEDGLPVKVDLNWGFENDPDVPCELYLKEFHLIPEMTNCDEVLDTAFDPAKSGNVQARRSGTRWIFQAAHDVPFLEGKYPDLARLFMVRQTAEAIGLPMVKVTGVCPGAEQIAAVWTGTATDADIKPQADIDRDKQAVIERCLIRWTEGKKKGQIYLRSASVELVKRKP